MKQALNRILVLLLLCTGGSALAQDSVIYNMPEYSKKGGYSKAKQKADKLKASLATDDESQTAWGYESLSAALAEKGDYNKAEGYLQKALDIYTRQRDAQSQARTRRSLGKLQESQNKIVQAIESYHTASEVSPDKTFIQANANDANRLRANENLQSRMDYSQQNARLFEKSGQQEEAAQAYRQLAETQLEQRKAGEAVASYKKAISATGQQEAVADLTNQMAKAYAANNEPGTAIGISRAALDQARTQKDTARLIVQLQQLAALYTNDGQPAQAAPLLEEAYTLALRSGNTLGAKAALVLLAQYYKAQNAPQKSLDLYEQFTRNLDTLIRNDSSLVDARMFDLTESRIKELEKERDLQKELIQRKNVFNYVMAGSSLLMLVLLFFIARSRYVVKIKNKKIALQSLRREMNPHFIFNSLNSVNQYIAENNELEANKYLTSYSGLMRNIMEHSNKDFVTLSTELEQLKKYLELEHLRFSSQFDFGIEVDEQLDTDAVMVPNMLIQPHLENAIWHGLRYREGKGQLWLSFRIQERLLLVTVRDNGIGISRSRALKTVNQKAHESRGITNTTERIGLLNDLYKSHISMQLEELQEPGQSGTRVTIRLPLIHKS
ncbi:tetratricopeptide repeat-containing sensor histidine kinase [Taibaiella chishuiensis]|uniref:Tetratricopeptide repeat protein n=1 Tax=Taibaiella chishuiensis TaxID=1434707 RepID=A0A2P8D9N9_9BACT|nr:histidine kinase [Taibaiella chishuiensis]PSK93936.1 tetratricopeptide repeat protein [Taibaiella chishuiensis]